MIKVKNIFILLTPFHLLVVDRLFKEKLNKKSSLVFYSNIVNCKSLNCTKIEILDIKFNRKKLFNSPFNSFNKTKQNVFDIRAFVLKELSNFDLNKQCDLTICTDKDVFTQVLINKLQGLNKLRNLNCIEEGSGFYALTNFKDLLISFIYKTLTPLLFGEKLYFIRQLGTHSRINNIYLRHLDLLPKKNSNANYHSFEITDEIIDRGTPKNNNRYLFFSFPEADYGFDKNYKLNFLLALNQKLNQLNKILIIKPHPRENIKQIESELLKTGNIEILDKTQSGEKIDYLDYEFIINYSSSIIFDILEKKYPIKRLLTIGHSKAPLFNIKNELKYRQVSKLSLIDFQIYD